MQVQSIKDYRQKIHLNSSTHYMSLCFCSFGYYVGRKDTTKHIPEDSKLMSAASRILISAYLVLKVARTSSDAVSDFCEIDMREYGIKEYTCCVTVVPFDRFSHEKIYVGRSVQSFEKIGDFLFDTLTGDLVVAEGLASMGLFPQFSF